MLNLIQINITGFNPKTDGNLNPNTLKSDPENFFNELFNLLIKSKNNTENLDVIFMPCLIPYLQNVSEVINIKGVQLFEKSLMNAIYELIKITNHDIKDLTQYPNSNNADKILSDIRESINKILPSFTGSQADTTDNKVKIEKYLIPEKLSNSQPTDIFAIEEKAPSLVNELSPVNTTIESKDLKNMNSQIFNMDTKDRKDNQLTQISLTFKEPSLTQDYIQKTSELPVLRVNELSQGILKALTTSNKTLMVQLEPPELGKILIRLTLDSYGVKADMRVEYPHVKEMLTNLLPEIKSNLQSSGVKISDFLLDLTREHKEYSDSNCGNGQRKYRGNQRFLEYFV